MTELKLEFIGQATRASIRSSLPPEDRVVPLLQVSPIVLALTRHCGRIDTADKSTAGMLRGDGTELTPTSGAVYAATPMRPVSNFMPYFFSGMTSGMMGRGHYLFSIRNRRTVCPPDKGFESLESDGDPILLVGAIDIAAWRGTEREGEGQRHTLVRSSADLKAFPCFGPQDLRAPLPSTTSSVRRGRENIERTASRATVDNLTLSRSRQNGLGCSWKRLRVCAPNAAREPRPRSSTLPA